MTDIDEQHEELRDGKRRTVSGGGSIEGYDPRVSRGLSIFMGSLGVVAVAVVGWVAVSINELNVNVAKLVVRLDAKESRDDTQDARVSRLQDKVEDLTGDVRTIQGRNLRGHPKEPAP